MSNRFISLFVLLTTQWLFATGQFLEKDQSGFSGAVSGEFPLTEDTGVNSKFRLLAGYSHMGILDASAFSTIVNMEEDPLLGELKATEYGAMIAGHILKPTSSLPIGMSLVGKFVYVDLNSDLLDDADVDVSATEWSFGGDVHALFLMGDMFSFQPTAGYRYGLSKIKTDAPGDAGDAEDDSNENSILLSIPVIFPLNQNKIVVDPGFTIYMPDEGDNVNTFSIGLRFVGTL